MRLSAAAFALACGLGLPCAYMQVYGYDDVPRILTLAGIGFAIGLFWPAMRDEAIHRADAWSLVEQRRVMNEATLIANRERAARLVAVAQPVAEP